jgi:hypothetical protein
MISHNESGFCTLEIGGVSSVVLTEAQQEVLKSIISSAGFQTQPSTLLVYVGDATRVSLTIPKNIRLSSTRPFYSFWQFTMSRLRRIGSFFGRITGFWSETQSKPKWGGREEYNI